MQVKHLPLQIIRMLLLAIASGMVASCGDTPDGKAGNSNTLIVLAPGGDERIIGTAWDSGPKLFVSLPPPRTCAWTGSLAAVLFGLKFSHAFLSILIGVCIAGVIVTCLSLLGWVGAVIAGVGLSILAILSLWRARR